MKAKIISATVRKETQIDLEVLYTDIATGFSRTNIFTIPSTDATRFVDIDQVRSLVIAQGMEYKKIQDTNTFLATIINNEVNF